MSSLFWYKTGWICRRPIELAAARAIFDQTSEQFLHIRSHEMAHPTLLVQLHFRDSCTLGTHPPATLQFMYSKNIDTYSTLVIGFLDLLVKSLEGQCAKVGHGHGHL
jgi:hypothetical protein